MVKAPRAESLWTATVTPPSFPSLAADAEADVCIVGAGIAGLTTGYLLSQAGVSVVIVDAGQVASGMTAVTTAHLSNAIDDLYVEIERLHGQPGAQLAADSHTAAIDRIEAIVRQEDIDCDFERLDGYLFLAAGQDEELLDREMAAAHRAGLLDVEKIGRAPVGTFDTGPCLRFPRQGQFHPLRYLAGLAKAVGRDGGRVFTNAHADRIEGGSPARVQVGKHFVTARAIVVATNTPVNDVVTIHTKQAPYMSYVIAALLPPDSAATALYWDTHDPYHYLRLHTTTTPEGPMSLLIVGGEDHKTGQAADTEDCYNRLERWARERFPSMGPIELRWGGQVMESIDGLAFIGANPGDAHNVFIATGDSGMGMTHGTIAGLLLTDLIQGRSNPWATLYDPSRKTLGAAGEYAKEVLNMGAQYSDWVTPGDVGSVDDIPRDCGAIVRRGLRKVAVYRDESGQLHTRSAVCPHLGCLVRWNRAEKTWDCPCHGSRFDKLGRVINGPANQPLGSTDF